MLCVAKMKDVIIIQRMTNVLVLSRVFTVILATIPSPMKSLIALPILLLLPILATAQHSYVGIQNSSRKSMVSAMMNPAEINNFDKQVEINLVSVNALFLNNVLTFSQLTAFDGDLWANMMSSANAQVDGDTHGSILLPSFGINLNKWSLGWANQFNSRISLIQINPNLGSNILRSSSATQGDVFQLSSPYNQRFTGVMWIESGIIVGRELINNRTSKLSFGSNIKLLIPVNYTNIGISELNGTLTVKDGAATLSNATGVINLTYNRDLIDARNLQLDYSNLEVTKPSSVGLDIGINYQAKTNGKVWMNSGVSVTNIGNLKFGNSNVSNSLQMNIPDGSTFQLDAFDLDLDYTLDQLLNSGFFSMANERNGLSIGLPTTLALYSEFRLTEQFFVSAFWQRQLENRQENAQIPFINVFAITPSVQFGKFEVFSPWGYFQISQLTGGLGLRYGGFFISSQTIMTSLLANRGTADVQMGLSWGFGQRRQLAY